MRGARDESDGYGVDDAPVDGRCERVVEPDE